MVEIAREYVPGSCNISQEEEARRLASGWWGVALTVALEVVFLVFQVPAPWRLVLFFPATLAASGFLQVAFHFCAGYGFQGVFNVSAPVGVTQTVEAAEARARDRNKALLIFGLAAGAGVLIAGLAFWLA